MSHRVCTRGPNQLCMQYTEPGCRVLQVLPSGTVAAEDEKAADSAFAAGDTVVVDGDEVRLQQLSFDISSGSDLTGGCARPMTAGSPAGKLPAMKWHKGHWAERPV